MKRHFIPTFTLSLICLMSLLSCQQDQFNREIVLPHSHTKSIQATETLLSDSKNDSPQSQRQYQCETIGRISLADCGVLIKLAAGLVIAPNADSESLLPEDLEEGELINVTYFRSGRDDNECGEFQSVTITCFGKIQTPTLEDILFSF